jgi:gamma-glutamyl:cysteine ligase YbdK (ATP-grasp superfamily)
MAARLIDTTEESLRPVTELLPQLLEAARPHAKALGSATELALVPALGASPGAARQRAYPADESGLIRLVAGLAGTFRDPG